MPAIEINGITLDHEVRGPEGAPPVVFSNSLGTNRQMWAPQVAALAGRFRCLTYDTRGHGGSMVSPRPFGIADLADDLAGLIEAVFGCTPVHVVGLSLGGMTAMALAIRRPDLVASLTPMATFARTASPASWVERAAIVRAGGVEAFAETILARWFTPGFAETQPALHARTRAMLLATPREGYAACCDAIRDLDLIDQLGTISAPTMVFSGADDPASPPSLQDDIRAAIPGAGLVRLSPAAHIMNLEQPEQVNALLTAWLDLNRSRLGAPASRPALLDEGLANRKAVLGAAHVARSLAGAGRFALPWQEFIMRTAWGEVWGDPSLPWKTRSLLTLQTMIALNREEEFKLHLRPALHNGVTLEELRAALIQAAVYIGVPAANNAFRWVRDVLGDAIDAPEPVPGER
jgi:3-oxoadipate enol-lactonase / 4-carboxymuconolactone decarboxylase